MAVDAVMSMMGTGLGDAVVEGVCRVVLARAGHIGADWRVGSFEQSSVGIPHEQSSVGIPHVVGGAMVVDAVMSMVGVGLGDAVVEAVLPGGEAINAGGHAMEAHAQEEPWSGPHCVALKSSV